MTSEDGKSLTALRENGLGRAVKRLIRQIHRADSPSKRLRGWAVARGGFGKRRIWAGGFMRSRGEELLSSALSAALGRKE